MPRVVPIITPTRGYQGAVANSIVCIVNAIYRCNREPMYVQFSAHGYAFVRTGAFNTTREILSKATGKDMATARGFLLDDDVVVQDTEQLVKVMRQADQEHWNVVAPYLTTIGEGEDRLTSIAKFISNNGAGMSSRLLSIKELREVQVWDRVDAAGLGFYYGDIPLDYSFHADGKPFDGEDLNFFWDLREKLQIRLAPIHLKHLKTVELC